MAKVFTIPVPPDLSRKKRERTSDPRYVDGQKMLVEAMKYLAQADVRETVLRADLSGASRVCRSPANGR